MDSRLDWALGACARVMRPLIRMALAMGVKHGALEGLLRDLLLDEARRSWRSSKGVEPNISQLSVTTGLNRKVVTARVREEGERLPHTEMSAAAKTLTAWLQLLPESPESRTLPISSSGEEPSFEAVARRASRGNVHHRTILEELVRLNMVSEEAGRATLIAESFVPSDDLRSMLAFVGDNGRDHLMASVSNTLGQEPRMLERSVFANGLTLQDCETIQQLMRTRWTALHHEVAGEMTRAVDTAGDAGSARMRVGVYVYYEDDEGRSSTRPS